VLARGTPLAVNGEMVAVLLEQGNLAAALELEEAWNDLRRDLPFSLLCAYPDAPGRAPTAAGRDRIRRLHSDVLEPLPRPVDAEWSCTFPKGPRAPAEARRFVVTALQAWGAESVVHEGALLVTELATNAVAHARSSFSVSLTRRGDAIRISVGDAAPAMSVATSARSIEHGRGIHLIELVSRSWGVEPSCGGKLVWVELMPAPAPAQVDADVRS
jgi:hypothetical protein